MKKRHLLLVILIQFFFAAKLMSQTIITLTFTANTGTMHQPLDSVVVENLTRGGDTVMHYPDTVLLLDHGTGVFNPYKNTKEGMILYPSFPNPFTGFTTMRLFLPDDDVITIRVFDLLGRQQAVHHQSLPPGEHIYKLYPGSDKHYLLVVETSHDRRVQKLISIGGEGAFRIDYSGSYQQYSGFRKNNTGFAWAPGDDLRFCGFVSLEIDTIVDSPLQSELYTFLVLPPVANFSASDTLVLLNDTVHFTDLSTRNPTTWKWFFGDGDSSMIQNPSKIYTTSGIYSVTLIVCNSIGTDTLTKAGLIYAQPPYPPGYVHCDSANPTVVLDVTNPITGRIWMDRNLGATQVATSSTDTASYGDLYQWGRLADGHQCRTSSTSNIRSNSDVPGHGNFIIGMEHPYDWRAPQNSNLWQGVNGVNNPCPIGYRLPSYAELNTERLSWSSNNSAGAFASALKIPLAGNRSRSTGSISEVGVCGYYWCNVIQISGSMRLYLHSSNAILNSSNRALGHSVRCIKDY